MHLLEDPIMDMCSNFHADICMLNICFMLVNFGPENWSRVLDVGADFYSVPFRSIFFDVLIYTHIDLNCWQI